jgi:hypothetical protein
MDFATQWPLILVVLAAFIILAGLLRKIAKLAFFGVALAALGIFIWPFVADVI